MRVGVAVAVQVPALVDGNARDRELDVLTLARVEAAHEDLLGVPLPAFVGQQDPGASFSNSDALARGTSASWSTRS